MQRLVRVLVALALAAVTTGCEWRGLNSLPVPGTAGGGPGSYIVQAQLPDVTNLEPNARVRVDDVTVGTVTKIEKQGWHAVVSIRLGADVRLPENATATIGQTSLLGSLHVELAAPTDLSPAGVLHDGSLIPLAAGRSYPTTEETLAAISLVLNGGGLGQVQDITRAFSTAFAGRENDLRSLIDQLAQFTGRLNTQIDGIIAATDSLNRLAAEFAQQSPVLDKALRTIPDALTVLKDQRTNLADAFDQFGKLSALAGDSVNQTKEALVQEVKDLGAVLQSLADTGPALTTSLDGIVTYPFPKSTLTNWVRGDFGNATMILDLTLSRLDSGIFTGTRFEGELTELEMQWGRTIGQQPSPYTATNPLTAPYHLDQGP
jgi:phospholipid/cholesterol/gamma-HCH transport system substrate-binding protein